MIRWGSVIAEPDGTIDYARVRSLVSVMLALVGGLITTAIVLVEIAYDKEVPIGTFSIMVSALVLPLTGGKIADIFSSVSQSKVSAKIQTGETQGRRATDPALPPPAAEG